MSTWKHRTLAAATDLDKRPPVMTATQAQAWCNFIVWAPEALPDGWVQSNSTMRKEAPPGRPDSHIEAQSPWSQSNAAAFRYEISDGSRRLRVKQFLYDWAFPALDHPCLWQSSTRARVLEPTDRGAFASDYVVWFGIDYLKNQAASARLERTLIELSVLAGEFTEDELVDLFESLRPVDPEVAAAITRTRFSQLSYWARHNDAQTVSVPVGLWKFGRPEKEHHETWAEAPPEAATEVGLPDRLGGFELDDLARYAVDEVAEWEAVFVAPGRRGRELRLIVQESGGGRISAPPEPSLHTGERESITVAGAEVHLAWIDDRYGPFDAVWRDDRSRTEVKLLSTTGVGMHRAWFVSAVCDAIERLRLSA